MFLDEVFGTATGEPRDTVNIVVLQADDQQFGLVVDQINDTAEIVVKPLGKLLKHVDAFAGATIMGDGRVALILDTLGIARHAGVTADRESGGRADHLGVDSAEEEAGADRRTLLLCRLGERRAALLLEMVARLEEFERARVEVAGRGRVVQYRGEIMPLVFLADELAAGGDDDAVDPAAPLQVVVYTESGRSVGLVVDEIFDIVEQSLDITRHTAEHGLLGAAVIQDAVTDVVDVHAVLATVLPELVQGVAA